MTAGGARQRRGSMGTTQWAALGISALVILGLTFTLGALVGRQWARHSAPALAADPVRKAAPGPRRSGLTDVAPEQPPAAQEKLTFYKTLTAPLEPTPFPVKPEAGAKSDPAAKPAAPAQASPVSAVASGSERTLPRAEERPSPVASASSSAAKTVQPERAERRAAGPEWTVQVGVFGNVDQAVAFKRGLDRKGFETQIAPAGGSDGQVRYRVRVGTFHSREEALREAERVRSERSLPTYVTAK